MTSNTRRTSLAPFRALFVAVAAVTMAGCDAKTEGETSTSGRGSELSSRIDSLVAESMRDGKVPGIAVTVVRGDSLVHSKGYGFANLERQLPMTDSTPVVIGSTSKTFTAFALMQLVDSGRIALDSSVTHYVAMLGAPRPPRDSGGARVVRAGRPADPRFGSITVRQLLTNTSGIPAGFSGDAYDAVDTTSGALERIVRDDMLPRRLDFDPGSSYEYSNRGFSLASLVVQDVSGMSYEDYIAARILEPLGMRHSTGRFWEGERRGMVQGYRESVDGKPLARPASLGREWTGSGMILSTSRDIALYLRAILDSGRAPDGTRLLSAAGTAELLRPQQKAESELGGPTMYGLGWEISEVGGETLAMKAGSVGTMGSLFVLIPAQKTGIVVLINDIDYGKVQLVQNLVKLLLGAPTAPYAATPAAAPVAASEFRMPPERLRAFAGVYDTKAGVMRLTVRGDTLAVRYEGNDAVLEPTSDSSFVMRSVLREQEGTALVFRRCGRTTCAWIEGDSSAVKR